MKWSLKLITEFDSAETKVDEVASWERADTFIKPANLGMSTEESKRIAAGIRAWTVSDQVDGHNKALTACRFCGRRVRTKGYYRSIVKSVFGNAPMRGWRTHAAVWHVCDLRFRSVAKMQESPSKQGIQEGAATEAWRYSTTFHRTHRKKRDVCDTRGLSAY
ncbi:MAG: hypothetical protein ACRD11_07475 [Terriglobia bacterium]